MKPITAIATWHTALNLHMPDQVLCEFGRMGVTMPQGGSLGHPEASHEYGRFERRLRGVGHA